MHSQNSEKKSKSAIDVSFLTKDIKIETINENLVEEEKATSRNPSFNIQNLKAIKEQQEI